MTTGLHLVLDLEPADEPANESVRGRLRGPEGGDGRRFHGYLGLIAAIEAARETGAAATDAQSGVGDAHGEGIAEVIERETEMDQSREGSRWGQGKPGH